MRLIAFADLHLDAAFASLSPQAARIRRQALRRVLRRILALAREREADAILCGGDLYEQERFTPDLGEFLRSEFGSIDIPIYVSPGNHDWVGPTSLYRQLDWPDNVHIFDESSFTPVELASGLRLWGAAHRAPANTDGFFDSGFVADDGAVNISLFHGSERHLLAKNSGKIPHAPFDAPQIANAGILYAFVGHYHVAKDEQRFSYPGNPDPLTFGESGPRGVVIADIDGHDVSILRERVAETEIHDIELDLTDLAHQGDVIERAKELLSGLGGFARVTIHGTVEPTLDLSLDDLENTEGGLLAPPVVRIGTIRPGYDLEALQLESTVRGEFVRDVLASEGLTYQQKTRVLTTGLRALDGRTDLEVPA